MKPLYSLNFITINRNAKHLAAPADAVRAVAVLPINIGKIIFDNNPLDYAAVVVYEFSFIRIYGKIGQAKQLL